MRNPLCHQHLERRVEVEVEAEAEVEVEAEAEAEVEAEAEAEADTGRDRQTKEKRAQRYVTAMECLPGVVVAAAGSDVEAACSAW